MWSLGLFLFSNMILSVATCIYTCTTAINVAISCLYHIEIIDHYHDHLHREKAMNEKQRESTENVVERVELTVPKSLTTHPDASSVSTADMPFVDNDH
jgi:hypothetical protein